VCLVYTLPKIKASFDALPEYFEQEKANKIDKSVLYLWLIILGGLFKVALGVCNNDWLTDTVHTHFMM